MIDPPSHTPPATAVVLAAGKGTRMNTALPKVLCPVVDRPMIHFVLDAVSAAGIDSAIVVVGYRGDDVEAEVRTRTGDATTFVTQHAQLGTGHAVQMCRDALTRHADQAPDALTLVVAGDSPLIQPDSLRTLVDRFADATRSADPPALLLGTLKKDDPTGLGRIVRDDAGRFTGIVEHKDATESQRAIREVNMSTYLFRTADLLWALDHLGNDNAQGEYYLTDCARLLFEAGRPVEAAPVLKDCEALSINNPDELELVDKTMRAMGYA